MAAFIYGFRSQKAAERIATILGKIGDCGGRKAFAIEKTDSYLSLMWLPEVYIQHMKDLAEKEKRPLPTSMYS